MTEGQKGNAYIIFEGLIWSLFPIVTILGLKGVPSIVGLFWATLFSAVFFLAIIIVRGKWQELKNLQVWKYSFGVAIFIGVIFYGLFFYGLTKTVSANGAIVALFEVATSYILFQVIHKEFISRKQILGIIFATFGALLIFIPKFGHFYGGDIFILLATFFAPFGNWYQQKARNIASSETIMLIRNIITIPFLLILTILIGTSPFVRLPGNTIWWLLLNGILIFGLSKLLWVEGIHRMTVTKALAINSLSPFFTIIFAWILIGDSPTPAQLLSLPLLVIGIFLLTNVNFTGILSFKKREASLK
jgi:drug/metabolite transporter (DMT)-like permease